MLVNFMYFGRQANKQTDRQTDRHDEDNYCFSQFSQAYLTTGGKYVIFIYSICLSSLPYFRHSDQTLPSISLIGVYPFWPIVQYLKIRNLNTTLRREILSPNTGKRSEGNTYSGQSLTVALAGSTSKISFHAPQ
jgi:hypothetical protein